MVGSAFVPPSAQIWMWAAVTLVWICTGFLITSAATGLTSNQAIVTESLVERFGLFTIIVLGEVVVGVVDGASESVHSAEAMATGLIALCVGFGLWWNYFDLTGRRLPREDRTGLPVWIALHLPLTCAIAATGPAIVNLIEHSHDPNSPRVAAWVLSGAVAVVLGSIAGIVRTLDDWGRYRAIYLPTSIIMVILAVGSLAFEFLRPEPIMLVSSHLAILALAWLVALYRWLRTEGVAES